MEGVADPLETCFSSTVKIGHSRSNGPSVIFMESSRKNWTPFGVTQITGTNTDQAAIYDFLLVFRTNYGPISCSLRDKWRRYLQNFPTHLYLTPPLSGLLLEFCTGGGAPKRITIPQPESQKSVTIC